MSRRIFCTTSTMTVRSLSLDAVSLSKSYGRTRVFENVSFSIATGASAAFTGPNGSGKSTLCDIAAGIRRPDRGTISHSLNGAPLQDESLLRVTGLAAPRVNPYDELTGMENVRFAARVRGADPLAAAPLFEFFGLARHRDKLLRHYSSGMRQRLKLILSVLHDPALLILDEPGANLDDEGRWKLAEFIERIRARTALIIATNDRDEASLCSSEVRLD